LKLPAKRVFLFRARSGASGSYARIVNLALSPDFSWNTVVQYDNISRQLGLNSRIRWTWSPGNDVFLVVNNGWQYETGDFRSTDTGVTLKVGSTFRF